MPAKKNNKKKTTANVSAPPSAEPAAETSGPARGDAERFAENIPPLRRRCFYPTCAASRPAPPPPCTRRLTRSHPIGSAPNPSQVTPEQRKAALEAKDAGNKEFTAGNYDAAAKHFTAAIEADPTDHGTQPPAPFRPFRSSAPRSTPILAPLRTHRAPALTNPAPPRRERPQSSTRTAPRATRRWAS